MPENPTAHIASLVKSLKRVEAALERSRREQVSARQIERRLRSMVDDMPVGVALVTQEGRFLETNSRFCDILGYDREELLALTYLDVTYPDDRETDKQFRTRLLAGDIPAVKWEKRYIRKDGTLVWVNFNLSITHPLNGDPQYFLAVIENISERRSIEESLYRIASNLAQADSMSLSGTWDWHIDTGEVRASPEVFDLFSLPPSGKPVPIELFTDRIDPRDRQMFETVLWQAVADQKPYQVKYRLNLPDGPERVILGSGEIYERDAATNKPRVMVGLVQDVTLQTRTEQALVDSEHRFRVLFDNAVDAIFIANESGIYTAVNRSACALLGYRSDELIGRHISDLLRPEDRERLAKEKEYFLQSTDHTSVAEWDLKHRDGHYLPVEASARILPDGRWMATVRDIRERRQTLAKLEKYHAEIRDLYDNAPCGYHTLDRDNTLVQVNQTELRWLGYAREELIGKSMMDLLTEPCRKKFQNNLPRLKKEGRLVDVEFDLVRKDGSEIPVLISATSIYDHDGNFMQSRMTIFDMTALAEAQKKLRQAAAVFEHTTDAIMITNADGRIVAANTAFAKISGYQPEEVIGKNPSILKSGVHDPAFYDALWSELARTGSWQGEIWDRKKSGETFPVWESITAVRDDSGNVTDYISVFSDITTIKQTEERLIKLAYHDSLTGLPNRLLFNDRIVQAINHAKRHHTRSALLLLDLDRFKSINDTLGHDAGDLLLKAIAIRLKDAIRSEDTVARLGGDEFAIVLSQIEDPADAALMAQKVARLLAEPIHILNQVLAVSTSIGIGIYPDDADDQATLYKCADTAMYEAKNKGRNGYQFYTREMTAAATETLLLDRDLRRALRCNELSLVYQPQVNLATGRIVGVEALARWNRPDHGPQSPARFIRIAEETDLIESIGEWAIDTALSQLDRWRMAGVAPIRMAINLSVRQIRRAHFKEDMRRRLESFDPASGFGVDLELTETTLQTEAEIVEALMDLKSVGLKIAVDDFGTGYSSLNSLKHLPVDALKIDRSFIHGIPSDPDGKAITTAIIAMGHSLGMNVIAEGIETQEQLQFVMGQQCDDAQGYLFFPPLEADECERFLMAGAALPVRSVLGSRPA